MPGLYELLHESAAKYPRKAFVKDMERTWTYSGVDFVTGKISEYMLERGIKKGDRVIVLCNNSIQYVAAFFAVLRINAVAVPVNPAKMNESILYIIEKCKPGLILTCDAAVERLNKVGNTYGADILNIDRIMAKFPQAGDLSGYNPIGMKESNLFGYNPIGMEESKHAGYNPIDTKESDEAIILFTSGTTADPKGVTLTHGNLIENTKAIVGYLGLSCEDSVLMTLPFTYSYGNSVLLTHACVGGTIVIDNAATFPYKVLEDIRKERVSGFSTVGSYINLLLKCIRNSDPDKAFFDHLRYITLAGEATNKDDIRFIKQNHPGVKLFVMYGQTEASARLSYLDPELLRLKEGSVGKGLCNVTLRVVNEEGEDVRPGEVGEIIAHGPSIMKGYWGDPVATDEAIRNGWLYTGDIATVDEEGYIFIKGRKTDMIKHMGHRISPVEIESVINSCGNVRESAAVESVLDGMSIIKAFVVLENDCSLDELKKSVCKKLPVYLRPNIIEITDNLPRTESGKIRRSALRGLKCAE